MSKQAEVVNISAKRVEMAEPWENNLLRTKKGAILATSDNCATILRHAPEWRGVLAYDDFAGRVRVLRRPPMDPDAAMPRGTVFDMWSDQLTFTTSVWVARHYGVSIAKGLVADAIDGVARLNSLHPLRAYLQTLEWDGKKRLDKWLSTYVMVDDSPYVRAVGAKWLISAVARAYQPGCQADYVLIIEGGQRGGKSSALRALCEDPEWFLSTDIALGSKDSYQVIAGKWLVELAELDSLAKSEVSRVKSFITCRADTYRPSYGRSVIDQRRGCVFAGSTNDVEYLKDDSGGGRWWPVKCLATIGKPLNIRRIEKARPQLWAEAVVRYKAGEHWWLEDTAILAAAQAEQEARRQCDPWEQHISEILRGDPKHRSGVTVQALLSSLVALGHAGAHVTRADSMRVAHALQALGWVLVRTTGQSGRRAKVYEPGRGA